MAGNFWQSSHFQQWLLDRQDLLRERHHDLQIFSEEEYQKVMIFFANFIQALGEQLKVKQQVIATATVYFKRFYVRNSLKCIDPLLMAPTCIFLASKVEEFGVISNSRLISTCQTVVKNKFSFAYPQEFPYRMTHVLECEFYLLEMMDCCLVLYHPYRPLVYYVQDIGQEETLLPMAWKVINDSLRTDVCLLYPPHQIALACLHMACVILGKDCKQWFAELNVDMEKEPDVHYMLCISKRPGQATCMNEPAEWTLSEWTVRDVFYYIRKQIHALSKIAQTNPFEGSPSTLTEDFVIFVREMILEITRQILSLYDAWKLFDEKKEVPLLLAKVPKPKTQPTRPPSQGPGGTSNDPNNPVTCQPSAVRG